MSQQKKPSIPSSNITQLNKQQLIVSATTNNPPIPPPTSTYSYALQPQEQSGKCISPIPEMIVPAAQIFK